MASVLHGPFSSLTVLYFTKVTKVFLYPTYTHYVRAIDFSVNAILILPSSQCASLNSIKKNKTTKAKNPIFTHITHVPSEIVNSVTVMMRLTYY